MVCLMLLELLESFNHFLGLDTFRGPMPMHAAFLAILVLLTIGLLDPFASSFVVLL